MAGLQIYATEEQLAEAAAEHFVDQASEAFERQGRFCVALSGGKTPRAAYTLIARPPYVQQVDWQRVFIFFDDERCLPPEHPDSNYRMARESLLDRVDIPKENIYRMRGEIAREDAAREYDERIRSFFGMTAPGAGDQKLFDLAFMGIGPDGHTASLFPGDPALEIEDRWAAAVIHRGPPAPLVDRITLTRPAYRRTRQMTFLVSGAEKSAVLRQILQPEPGIEMSELPAAQVWAENDNVLWLVDTPASAGYREGEM
ncbi:MAG TPA: 6-phosphogluconolactonase [Arenibaculum sp.]|nr:6-phosphogluconolactonase [Arenibaculum sp.]